MSGRTAALFRVLLGLLSVATLVAVGEVYADGFRLELGSLDYPDSTVLSLMASYGLFGSFGALLLSLGTGKLLEGTRLFERASSVWIHGGDGWWMAGAMAIALILPVVARLLVLGGAPITDDESAYQFSAELLARGQLWVPSHESKLFFDRNFLINDGKMYTQYPLGWPALMVPFVLIGIPGYANAFYSCLAVPPIFLLVRELSGRSAARLGVVLYLCSPFMVLLAATQMAHTTCAVALAWVAYLFYTVRGRPAPLAHAALACAFGLAFAIRPVTAIGFGGPLVVLHLVSVVRDGSCGRAWRLAGFLVPLLATGVLLLFINFLQTGDALKHGYQAAADYYRANDFRFSTVRHDHNAGFPIRFSSMTRLLGVTGGALLRLNLDAFGWPSSLVFALFALADKRVAPYVLALGGFLVAYSFSNRIGVDTVGPSHYHEALVLLIILTAVGIHRLGAAADRIGTIQGYSWLRLVPTALVASSIVLAAVVYLPVRLDAVRRIATNVNDVLNLPERAGVERGVVFAPFPLVHPCRWKPRQWVFFRNNNNPLLTNSVLWVNDVSDVENARFLRKFFPDRQGFRVVWMRNCEPALIPLEQVKAGR